MKKSVKRLLLIALAMVLAGALLSGAALALGAHYGSILLFNLSSSAVRAADTFGYRAWENEYSADGSYTLDAAGIVSVDLKWLAGFAAIAVHEGGEILLSETALAPISKKNALRYGVADGTLHIQYCDPGTKGNLPLKSLVITLPQSLAAGMETFSCETSSAHLIASSFAANSFSFRSASGTLGVDSVTADAVSLGASSGGLRFSGTYRILTAQTGSASVVVESLSEADRTDIETSSGDVFLSGDCGALRVNTSSGAVANAWEVTGERDFEERAAPESVNLLIVDSLAVHTSSGDVRLTGAFQEARVETSSGMVRLSMSVVPDVLEVSASSGRVWLGLPENAGFTLRYDTASGELSCGFAAIMDGKSSVVGDGAGAFRVETASGDLVIAVWEDAS